MFLFRLLRLSLLPSILWDFLAGMVLAGLVGFLFQGTLSLALPHLGHLAALIALYHGGLVLNDWVDRDYDSQKGRKRPICTGECPPTLALVLALALLAAGSLPFFSSQQAWLPQSLLAIILAYDLGGRFVRTSFGPLLLACARGLALCFGPLFFYTPSAYYQLVGLVPIATYAIYFLFLSRLGQREEDGVSGMRGLPFVFLCSLAPLALTQLEHLDLAFWPAWVLFVFYILSPAWKLRHHFWTPAIVQKQMRRLLSGAPVVLSLILLAVGSWQWALLGPVVSLGMMGLARLAPPE